MLIFLDIDGVMVPAKSWTSPILLNDGFPAFSSEATHVLQRLISDDTTVMLTTSHKASYTIEAWKNIFKKRGISVTHLKSLANNTRHLSRKDEILNWINSHKISENFVIIDDDKSLNELPPHLKEKLVLTKPFIGLKDEHLGEIKSVLGKNLQFI